MPTQFPDNEEHLLLSFQTGDENAFNQLYTQFYPRFCFFASRLTGDRLIAEEIVQDTLFTFWKKKKDFPNFKAAKAFIYVSVRNACMNHLDKENRKAKKIKDLRIVTETTDQPVMQEIILAEVISELRNEVAKLPEQCAKVIRMLYEDEMKPQEIADELQITVSTVYNQKMRGISLLKKRLPAVSANLGMLLLLMNGIDRSL
ncbi:MAG: RNA polymerase sigma-70 factor [Chitinophagaceae bacterium]|nr:RNA polymerase sigma-70 factor [Chitinophagaceae bacterium]